MNLKSHKTSVAVFVGSVLLIALAVVPVLAQRAGGGPGGPNGDGPRPMAFQDAPDHPGFGGMGQRGPGRMGENMREERQENLGKMLLTPMARQGLGLTDEQVTKIRQLNYDLEKQNIQLEADQKMAHLDLEQLMSADDPDRKAINAQIERIGTVEIQKRQLDVNRHLDLREVLTKEQREKIEKFRGEMMQARMHDRANRPGMEQGPKAERRQQMQQDRPERDGRGGGEGRRPGPWVPRPEAAPEQAPSANPNQQ